MSKFVAWFIVCFFSTSGITYLYYKLLDVSHFFRFRNLVLFIVGVLFATLLRYYNIEDVSFISYFIFYPVFFYSLKPQSFKSLIYFSSIIFIYGMILDLLSMLIVSLLIFLFDLKITVYWLAFIMTFVVFIFMILLGLSKTVKNITNKFYDMLKKINYPDFLLLVFTMFILLIGIVMFINLEELSINFVLSILCFLIFFDFIFLIKYKINSTENVKFIEILRNNNQFYINMDNENRIFKHNLVAKLLSIKSVSNSKSRKLIDDLLERFNFNVDFSKHIKDIPYGLNGILYQKIYPYLKDIEIKMDNEIHYDIFEFLTPRRYNVLVEKMIVSLDNAIEASIKSIDKIIIINLYEENNDIIVEIKNSISEQIDVDALGKINYSTKRRKSGLGLFSAIREKEVSLNIKIINNMFVARLEAKKNK